MENTHTAGIWSYILNPFSKTKQYEIKSADVFIATIHGEDVEDHEVEANAKLIAAAPELLKALQNMVNISYDTAKPTKAEKNFNLDQAIAAIKAATN